MGTGILMEHHPRQWGPLALDAVLANLLGCPHNPSTLEHRLEPTVAPLPLELGLVNRVKVSHIPAFEGVFVQIDRIVNPLLARLLHGHLTDSQVHKATQAIGLEAINVSSKGPFTLTQNRRHL